MRAFLSPRHEFVSARHVSSQKLMTVACLSPLLPQR